LSEKAHELQSTKLSQKDLIKTSLQTITGMIRYNSMKKATTEGHRAAFQSSMLKQQLRSTDIPFPTRALPSRQSYQLPTGFPNGMFANMLLLIA
jgi:hypothetical protein